MPTTRTRGTSSVKSFLDDLSTEQPNPRSAGIDTRSTVEILQIISAEDATVPAAVARAAANIAPVVDAVVASLRAGGRLFYVGAGTSGRLGVLDAAECPPTFSTAPEMVQAIIAGGREALVRSVEGAEDDEAAGAAALEGRGARAGDVVVGITASGQAPFVLGAMRRARALGCVVAAISRNRGSRTFPLADHRVLLEVGPEIILGSTRMKGGTAQKLALNMISTAAMIRLGKVYDNLMVDLLPVNQKLMRRSVRLIRMATGCDEDTAERAFAESGRRPKKAIMMVLLGVSLKEAEDLLEANEGRIGEAAAAFRRAGRGRHPETEEGVTR